MQTAQHIVHVLRTVASSGLTIMHERSHMCPQPAVPRSRSVIHCFTRLDPRHPSQRTAAQPLDKHDAHAPVPRRRPRPAAPIAVVRAAAAIPVVWRAVAVVRRGVPVVWVPVIGRVPPAVAARASRRRSPPVIGALAIPIAVRPGRPGRPTAQRRKATWPAGLVEEPCHRCSAFASWNRSVSYVLPCSALQYEHLGWTA